MQRKKHHLQRHRMKAFTATLLQIENRLQQQIDFVLDYAEVYKFPKRFTRRNLKQYKIWLKATQQLMDIEKKHIS